PRNGAVRPGPLRLAVGPPAFPPLPPRRQSGRQELRRAPAVDRPPVRHRLPARRALAGCVRNRRPSRAGGLLAPAGVAVWVRSGADAKRLRVVRRGGLGPGAPAPPCDLPPPPPPRARRPPGALRG